MVNPDRMLRRVSAAAYLEDQHGQRASVQTLARRAVEGSGPLYRLSGRFPLYRIADLDAWAAARLSAPRRSTSDQGAGS